MLLVVSVGDRKARIELGAGWGHRKDEDAKRLMERKIVPEFKRGRMSAGAVEGAKGLRSIAMGLAAPPGGGNPLDDLPGARSCGRGGTWIIVVLVAIVLLSAVSRRGSSWGPGGLGGMSPGCGSFGSGCLGAALGNMIFGGFGSRGGGWGGGGGGWSGGSRGGGSTGSW
jgi:uncharacterized protein